MKILKHKGNVCLGRVEIDVGDTGHITNCYLLCNEKDRSCILFDPADKAEFIVKKLDKEGVTLKAICLTHCHSDHISGLEDMCKIYEARGLKLKVYIHKNDREGLVDDKKNYAAMLGLKEISVDNIEVTAVKDGDTIEEGDVKIEVLHTPGHTDGCIMFYAENINSIITGDIIFSDCYGRVDLTSGSIQDMKESINKIFKRFHNIDIYPGHGESAVLSDVKRKIRLLLKLRK